MKFYKILIIIWLFIFSIAASKAEHFLNFWEFITIYFNTIWSQIPQSYKYIKLNFKNIDPNSEVYSALQKWVYMDMFPNKKIDLHLDNKVSQKQVVSLVKKNFWINFYYNTWLVTTSLLKEILFTLQNSDLEKISTQDEVMLDVYDILSNDYFFQENIDEEKMTYWAIKWLVNSLEDPYTQYFDPEEAKQFNDELNWDFEWIWAYIEKNKKWETIIISPIKWSPAEKAWLQAWDIIIRINNKDINIDENLSNIVKKIKWPSWSEVIITVKRWNKEIDFTVIRDKIKIINIEAEQLDNNSCYIWIHMFTRGIDKEFDKIIKELKNCNKYIFDVRNNPWGGLFEVSEILWHFLQKGEISSVIKSLNTTENLIPTDKTPKIDKNIIILINKWSASASEIFAWTIKDYIPSTILIWEQTFGKWSVQSVRNYKDWSILKYTQSRRYTWKSQRNIDKQWISPDIKIIDNPDTQVDEIFEFIKKLKF